MGNIKSSLWQESQEPAEQSRGGFRPGPRASEQLVQAWGARGEPAPAAGSRKPMCAGLREAHGGRLVLSCNLEQETAQVMQGEGE